MKRVACSDTFEKNKNIQNLFFYLFLPILGLLYFCNCQTQETVFYDLLREKSQTKYITVSNKP